MAAFALTRALVAEGLFQDSGFEQRPLIRGLGLVEAAEASKVFAGSGRVDVGAFRGVFDAGDFVVIVVVGGENPRPLRSESMETHLGSVFWNFDHFKKSFNS